MFGWLRGRRDPPAPPVPPVDLDDPDAVRTRLMEALGRVVDPELGIDIVSLGLVRQVEIDEGGASVVMTLTTPACPVGPWLRDEVRDAVAAAFPTVRPVRVELTNRPPWSPGDMSEAARRELGLATP